MTPWYRSVRTRVAAALALAAIATAFVLALVVDHATMLDGRGRLREQAIDALSAATAAYDFTGTLPPNASVRPDAAPRRVVSAVRPDTVVTWYDGRAMWAARRLDGEGHDVVLTLRLPATTLHHQRAALHHALLWATAVVAVVALGAGWLVAGSLTARLRRAARWVEHSRTAPDGAAGAAPAAPPTAHPARDEVDELVGRIAALARDLDRRMARERAFSADVAHELRTPVTALVSATELLPEHDEAAVLVRRQTTRVRRLVEDLLLLARAEHAPSTDRLRLESVDLGAFAVALAEEHPDVGVRLDAPATILTDPALLARVLGNLLGNALRHGGPPVEIRVSGRRVEVGDGGAGFPAELIAHGPRRFAASGATAGTGLGLSIAQAWASRLDASLTLHNDDGACATLVLPATPRADAVTSPPPVG